MAQRHNLQTKDDVPLSTLIDRAMRVIDRYNDATKPFMELFAEEVNQQEFEQLPNDNEVAWSKLAEGEHPEFVDIGQGKHIVMRAEKYGQALGMTQEHIRRETSDRLLRRIQKMLEGYTKREMMLVESAFKNGIADGTQSIWYDVDNYGDYTFTQTHDHTFATTQELFESTDNPYTATAAQPAHRHLEVAADQLRHHDRTGPFIALCSTKFVRRLKDEYSWEAAFDIPEASGLRSQSVLDFDRVVDNVSLVHSPWMSGDHFYLTQVSNDSPVKIFREQPMTFVSPTGAPVRSPGDFIGAYGSAWVGVKNVDPLAAVDVTGDAFA